MVLLLAGICRKLFHRPPLFFVEGNLKKVACNFVNRRWAREESDGDSCQEETSSESESERPDPVGKEQTENVPTCTPYREAKADDGFFSDDSDNNSSQHQLPVFQFFEHEPPYARQPLADKVFFFLPPSSGLLVYLGACPLWVGFFFFFFFFGGGGGFQR
jgi:Protein of unknown function (DUF789)